MKFDKVLELLESNAERKKFTSKLRYKNLPDEKEVVARPRKEGIEKNYADYLSGKFSDDYNDFDLNRGDFHRISNWKNEKRSNMKEYAKKAVEEMRHKKFYEDKNKHSVRQKVCYEIKNKVVKARKFLKDNGQDFRDDKLVAQYVNDHSPIYFNNAYQKISPEDVGNISAVLIEPRNKGHYHMATDDDLPKISFLGNGLSDLLTTKKDRSKINYKKISDRDPGRYKTIKRWETAFDDMVQKRKEENDSK